MSEKKTKQKRKANKLAGVVEKRKRIPFNPDFTLTRRERLKKFEKKDGMKVIVAGYQKPITLADMLDARMAQTLKERAQDEGNLPDGFV